MTSGAPTGCVASLLRIEVEVGDVAVFHDVALAFGPEPAGGADGRLGLVLLQVVDRVDVGPDEALFKIGVDDAGRLRRGGADLNFPGANLLRPCGEVAVQ